LEQDKQLLENVQQKAVNWVTGLAGTTYEEKCKELGLSTLENRRWEKDMVQTYKIMNGIGNIEQAKFFTRMDNRNTIQTRMAAGVDNVRPQRARTELRRQAFSMRIVQSWNGLPDTIKSARTVTGFKNGIKSYVENGGRPGYQ
jgi:hypothetical protein